MFYMYEHPFCKVVTSEPAVHDAANGMYEHPFCKVVTSGLFMTFTSDPMYEHLFCKVVTSVDLKITVLRDSMSILFERLLHPTGTTRTNLPNICASYIQAVLLSLIIR